MISLRANTKAFDAAIDRAEKAVAKFTVELNEFSAIGFVNNGKLTNLDLPNGTKIRTEPTGTPGEFRLVFVPPEAGK